jgi:hypothetical protein
MNNTFKFKSILTSFLIICVLTLTLAHTSYAQEADKESSNSASMDSIKKIIKDNLSSGVVQGAIDNLLNKKIATIGEVTRVTDETITINDRSGVRIIPIQDTHSISKADKEIEVSDIAVENWVTVLGKLKDDNFSPVFIYVHTKSLLPKRQVVYIGTITDITKNTIKINPRSGEKETTINILKSTDFEDLNGVEVSLSDLEEDITILVSGHNDDDDEISALTIKSLAPIADSPESN